MSGTFYFHGTSRAFERFESAFLHSGDGHANGMLGVWAACDPSLAARFGSHVLVVRPRGDRIHEIGISELSALANRGMRAEEGSPEFHRRYAEALRPDHDVLAIRESSGAIDMVVLLHPEEVEIVARVPSAEIAALPAMLEDLERHETGTSPTP